MSMQLLAAVGSLGVGFLLGGAAVLAVVEHVYSTRSRRQAHLQRSLNAEYRRLTARESDDGDTS